MLEVVGSGIGEHLDEAELLAHRHHVLAEPSEPAEIGSVRLTPIIETTVALAFVVSADRPPAGLPLKVVASTLGALTVGTLASNAVKMMPPTAETHGTAAKRMVRSEIGFGAAAMLQGRVAGEARKGREETLAYLEKSTAQDAASGEAKKGDK